MRWLIALASLSGCASFGDPGVVDRRVAGETHPGRFVDDTAYEVSLTAAMDEAAGASDKAEGGYLLLTRLDPESGDAWSRLGLTRCRRGVGAAHVDAAFARAAEVEPSFAPTFARRARCQLMRGDREGARASAARAFVLDPVAIDATEILVELARADGDLARAETLVRGARARAPVDAARAFDRPAPVTLRDVDTALLRGRFDAARAAAQKLGLSLGQLALRAAALGRVAFARELATALVANADDLDAYVALFASDPAHASVRSTLDGASPLARAVLRDALVRRGVGVAADAIVLGPSDDPLVAALARRR